jgi:Raf kinase inhibitor-like YbhB/YbcL family protein
MALLLNLFSACTASPLSPTPPILPAGDSAMQLTSVAFNEGEMIPAKYTCDGDALSPPLAWMGAPAETRAYALIVEDPDAPSGVWVHWVFYNLPADVTALPASVPATPQPAVGGIQGANSGRRIGYSGPCPPSGTHRYIFKLYALNAPLVSPGNRASAKDIEMAMQGHVLAQSQLMGRYARS